MSYKRHFFISTLLVALSSFLSRVLGLLRSTLLASKFGATSGEGLTDCYSAAFRIPDIIFNVVVFGTISIVFIPFFSGLIKKNENQKLKASINGFLNFFIIIVLISIFIGFLFTDPLVRNFLVKGWSNEKNILLTIKMTRILFLQVFFMTLSSIFGAYLNAIEKFFAYSLAILSYNVGIIIGIIFFSPFLGIEGVAWGAVFGSFMHFFIQLVGAILNGYRYSFNFIEFNNEIKELFIIAIPRIFAIAGEQLAKFFIVNFASFMFVGSIFIFENAENFAMVPFGTIAVSISTTTFPVFSKLYASAEYNELIDYLLEKIRLLLFLVLPITILMIIFRREIVDLLLTYKRYTKEDAYLTADSLGYYMLGIPFFSVTIVLVKFYYAQKRSFLPMIITFFMIFVTVFFCWVFSRYMTVSGLSLARSIGYLVQTILLVLFLYLINKKEKIFTKINQKIVIDIFKLAIINFGIFLVGFFAFDLIVKDNKFFSLLKLFFGSIILATFYFIICYVVKIPDTIDFINTIKNKINKYK